MSMSKKQLIKALTDIDDEHFKLARNFIEKTDSSLESADLEERLVELADRGVPEAQHALSKLIFLGWFGERDYQASFAWCNLAADNNFAPAVDLLASFFLEGKGGSAKDVEHALYLKQKAAALGYIPSLRSLAILHATGTGVKQDARISFGYLKLAAEKKMLGLSFYSVVNCWRWGIQLARKRARNGSMLPRHKACHQRLDGLLIFI